VITITRRVEDYLEAIYTISLKKNYVRVKDIASELNVRPATVTEMVQKLGEMGLVSYEKHGPILLTSKGLEIGMSVKDRHDNLKKLLLIIGVPEDIAESDACTMEHYLHPKTVEHIKKFVKFVETCPTTPKWIKHFKEYVDTGVHSCDR